MRILNYSELLHTRILTLSQLQHTRIVNNLLQEDADVPVLALVDLYGSQPVSSAAAGAASISNRFPGAKLRMAGLFHVHKGLYDERPGMRLLQV